MATTTQTLLKVNEHLSELERILLDYSIKGKKDFNVVGDEVLKMIFHRLNGVRVERVKMVEDSMPEPIRLDRFEGPLMEIEK